ncbi:hypothetical protein VTK26DRAFT_6340 [Humicola hyalothermophila]
MEANSLSPHRSLSTGTYALRKLTTRHLLHHRLVQGCRGGGGSSSDPDWASWRVRRSHQAIHRQPPARPARLRLGPLHGSLLWRTLHQGILRGSGTFLLGRDLRSGPALRSDLLRVAPPNPSTALSLGESSAQHLRLSPRLLPLLYPPGRRKPRNRIQTPPRPSPAPPHPGGTRPDRPRGDLHLREHEPGRRPT